MVKKEAILKAVEQIYSASADEGALCEITAEGYQLKIKRVTSGTHMIKTLKLRRPGNLAGLVDMSHLCKALLYMDDEFISLKRKDNFLHLQTTALSIKLEMENQITPEPPAPKETIPFSLRNFKKSLSKLLKIRKSKIYISADKRKRQIKFMSVSPLHMATVELPLKKPLELNACISKTASQFILSMEEEIGYLGFQDNFLFIGAGSSSVWIKQPERLPEWEDVPEGTRMANIDKNLLEKELKKVSASFSYTPAVELIIEEDSLKLKTTDPTFICKRTIPCRVFKPGRIIANGMELLSALSACEGQITLYQKDRWFSIKDETLKYIGPTYNIKEEKLPSKF